jgi:clan AA aspartic protease
MGKVMTRIKVSNATDLELVGRGLMAAGDVRSIEIEALVDTGATMLALPEDVAAKLAAPSLGKRKARDARGIVIELEWIGNLRLEILGREMTTDALILPAGATALIGQIPLEALDLLVDPKSRELRVNPESPDMPLLDLMRVAQA